MDDLEYSAVESRPGDYDVYYTPKGERLIVLEGLDPEQPVEHYPMQHFMIAHLDTFVVLYWLLLLCVSVYLIGTYLVLPLISGNRSTT